MPRTFKRTSYACSICCYRTNSATSLGNHKQEHEKQARKETELVCDIDQHTNVDNLLHDIVPNIETNSEDYEHCTPYVSYYEMTMDDFEE